MELNNVKEATGTPCTQDGAPFDVLISGAGPTGLALGIDLARRGVRALIVERQSHLSPGARGTGLQPRTQEVYEDLGVLAATRAAGGPYPKMGTWENGRIVKVAEMVQGSDPTPSAPYGNALMIPQWRNQEVLYAHLLELGGRVAFGTELTGFTQDADGVTARYTGTDGNTGTLRARYLVAADGGRSTVRKGLGVGMTGPSLPQGHAILADIAVDGLDRDHWHSWRVGERGFVALLPLARTELFQLFLVTGSAPDTSPAHIREQLAAHTHLTPDRITDIRWSSLYRPRAAMADRLREGRVFLAGDAAHVHSPAGGQGLNTSVQDAYNLGWKLGQVLRHGAPDALLDSYGTERLPIAARILETSTRLLLSGEMRRGKDLHQLDIGYPASPLTRELRTDLPEGALRAGDRAPDAPCTTVDGTPVRLFEALQGTHFTLLTLGDVPLDPAAVTADPAVLRVVRAGGPAPDLLDPDGHLGDAYGTAPAAYLIRPDGYLALAAPAQDATAHVAAALPQFTGAGVQEPVAG